MPVPYTPDLTGIDVNYYRDDFVRMVFKTAQKIVFDVPIHENVALEVFDSSGAPALLIKDTDYQIQPDDIAVDAMGEMKMVDPLFVGTLIKSITIIKAYAADYEINVKFQQLYPNSIDFSDMDPDTQIAWTPALLAYMVKTIEYVRSALWNKSGLYTGESSEIEMKPEDESGLAPENLINGEIHNINYMDNVIYIRPIYGSFYKDSLVVRNKNTQIAYTVDVDYIILEVDISKTARSSNVSGVYTTIKMLVDLVGETEIDYQTFGGEVDQITMTAIKDKVLSIEDFLLNNPFLSSATLRADPTFTTLFDYIAATEARLTNIEVIVLSWEDRLNDLEGIEMKDIQAMILAMS